MVPSPSHHRVDYDGQLPEIFAHPSDERDSSMTFASFTLTLNRPDNRRICGVDMISLTLTH